ncbi:MAG: aconitate hydratase [Clostridiales bacterium]|nr:aconitate hydratase [Clostridiales bacterium]
MKLNLTQKLILSHLVSGEPKAGNPIVISVDQTLTQDSTGTMCYLQLEALGVDKVVTKRSVAYIDHNTLQSGFENADDHAYIQSVALSHGVFVSKPGNGICHQVHLERFGVPGYTLVGSDSHTPTGGGIGMLAIGAGGLDVALAMAKGTLNLTMPEVIGIKLTGALKPNATAKDLILEVLRILSVKGGVGKIVEYFGDGVKSLSVPERATVTNMGAELGATTSVFPSDTRTKAFLRAQGRESDFVSLCADSGASYDRIIEIDLSEIEPLAAAPHMPDNVVTVSELAGKKVDQVCIGSCTDSSLLTMLKVAAVLKGKRVNPDVSLTISPGSKQVLTMLSKCGALKDILDSGARILECACGPCIGMGQSPKTNAVSLRTFNRNFYARSGTKSASVFLVSPLTAAYSAIAGVITVPPEDAPIDVKMPTRFDINDNLILNPADFTDIAIERGPNIKPFPIGEKLSGSIEKTVTIKVGDNITTDDIMPSNAKLLPYRSNIPYLSSFCLSTVDEHFAERTEALGGGIIVGGENYGQGSSREHAALAPLQLGIRAAIVKSIARIHRDNLINSGILPLVFDNPSDYDGIEQGDVLLIADPVEAVNCGKAKIENKTKGRAFTASLNVNDRQKDILKAGGTINYMKSASPNVK